MLASTCSGIALNACSRQPKLLAAHTCVPGSFSGRGSHEHLHSSSSGWGNGGVLRCRPQHLRQPVALQAAAENAAPRPFFNLPTLQLQAWQVVAALCAVAMFCCSAHRSVFTMLLPSLGPDFGLTMTQVGLVNSAMLIGYLTGQLPAGWLADKMGGERVLLASLALWSLATAATGLVTSLPALFAARFCMGIFSACAMPSVSAMAATWVPAALKASTISLIYLLFNLGGMVGLVATPSLAEAAGWRQAFFIWGGTGVVWSLISLASLPPTLAALPGHSVTHSQTIVQPLPGTQGKPSQDVGQGHPSLSSPRDVSFPGVVDRSPGSAGQQGGAPSAGKAEGGMLGLGTFGQPSRKVAQVLVLCWAHAVMGWGYFVFANWIPMYLTSLGSGLTTGGQLAGLTWLAAGTVGAVSGAMADRLMAGGLPRLTVRRIMQTVCTLGSAFCMDVCKGWAGKLVGLTNSCRRGLGAHGLHGSSLAWGTWGARSVGLGIAGNLICGWLVHTTGSYSTVFMVTGLLYCTSLATFLTVLDGQAL